MQMTLEAIFVTARVVRGHPAFGSSLARGAWLTPYMAEILTEDVMRAGPTARLEVTVPSDSSNAAVTSVVEQFAQLRRRGIQVDVRRSGQTVTAAERVRARG